MIEFTDTHCHIHSSDYGLDVATVLSEGRAVGVTRAICVGTTLEDSQRAINFVHQREGLWASIGIHPHETEAYVQDAKLLKSFTALLPHKKVVAIGECGLDYFYDHAAKKSQEMLLRFQLELAMQHKLPLIFHVREAFTDFWPIFDSYPDLRGVIHSFSSNKDDLDQILSRGLYVGLNGIMTFTKRQEQLEAAAAVPLNRLLLETDAPFLTPTPYRGIICQLKHVQSTGKFLARLRGEELEALGSMTSHNAQTLFGLT